MRWQSVLMLVTVLLAGCSGTPPAIDAAGAGTPAPSHSGRIEGVLSERDRPVAGATVTLTAYADDVCADLADAGGSTPAEHAQLAACTRDAGQVTTDADGRFVFDGLAAGRYRVTLTWETTVTVPTGLGSASVQQIGPWTVRYGHAHAVGGGWFDFAVAQTAILRPAPGEVQTLDLAHVPPR